jgi:GGDEF domain-containing protein
VTKPGDIAVRLGEEEFLLILRRQTSLIYDAAGMQANELIDMLNKPFVIDLNTVSVGLQRRRGPLSEARY